MPLHRLLWSFAAFFIVIAAPFAAQAQSDCDALVVDEAGAFGSGFGRVEAAAQDLANAGAVVRVRTVTDFGGYGSLDAYEASIEARCPSWRADDGGTRNNLIAIIVSYGSQRDLGMWYGTYWKPKLDDAYVRILAEELRPRLRDSDSVAGFVGALNETRTVVTARASGAGGPTTVINEKPADLSGLWTAMLVGLGILALCLLVYFVVQFQRSRAKRRAAQQKAKLNKTACSSYIAELEEPVTMLEVRVNDAARKVAEDEGAPLLAAMAGLKRKMGDATARYGELSTSATDPDRDGLSVDEYGQIAGAYDGVLGMLNEVRRGKQQLDDDVEKVKRSIDAAPARIDDAQAYVDASAAEVDAVAKRGFKVVSPLAAIDRARADLATARTALTDRAYGRVESACAAAKGKATGAVSEAASYEEAKKEIDGGAHALRARIDAAHPAIDEAAQVFQAIASSYADACWQTIRGNGTEAENRVEWAVKAIAVAEEAATMDQQRWGDAKEALAEAKGWLDEGDSFLRSIHELKKNLDAAKRDAQAEIDAAQADIDKARAYEEAHDADVDDALKGEVAEAQARLVEAKRELRKEKPDYLTIVKIALAANKAADGILARAQNEHEAAERKRQRAKTLLREAQRSVSAAKEYIEDHSSDVDSDAERLLGEATAYLKTAEAASDIDSRIANADQADKKADKALEMAKNDVDEAESARRRARARASSSASSSGWGSPSPFPTFPSTRRSSSSGGFGGIGSSSSRRSGGSLGGLGSSSRSGGSLGGLGGGSRRSGGSLGGW
jgi:hypothetical protein